MRRLLSISYGLAAYAAMLATLAYLVGFTANWHVPRSVDVGPVAPTGAALAIDLALLALFGVQHSLMARQAFKRWWTRVVPPVVERSTYLVATCAVLVALFSGWRPIAEPVVWEVRAAFGVMLLWALYALGWTLMVASSYLIDHFELFGLRQVFARQALPGAQLRTPLLYRLVRHPLYAGILLSLWSTPVMTAGHLLFASGLSVYVLVGIAFEERDLVRLFGERYRRYRSEVGMLIPWPKSGA